MHLFLHLQLCGWLNMCECTNNSINIQHWSLPYTGGELFRGWDSDVECENTTSDGICYLFIQIMSCSISKSMMCKFVWLFPYIKCINYVSFSPSEIRCCSKFASFADLLTALSLLENNMLISITKYSCTHSLRSAFGRGWKFV